MSSRFLFALAVGLTFVAPAYADPDVPKKPDPTADLLAKLGKPVDLDKNDDIQLDNLAGLLQQKFGIVAVVNVKAFTTFGEGDANGLHLKIPSRKGLPLGVVVRQILDKIDATFLVRRAHIEIVPVGFASQETKNKRLEEPLVSVIFKEKAFNEAVAELAEEYDLTVVVAPQSGDARMGFVTARLLNVPADKALELLALQCDLRVVRKGNAYLISSRDHVNEMFGERLEKERQKIEVEKLRQAPTAPAPEPPKPAEAPKP
ncbi:MAG: hypothetical protein C0467_11430 [Planctomycetaceae bacterium]|nr:hypothetical protein [Planctomycetaceae bacterium]